MPQHGISLAQNNQKIYSYLSTAFVTVSNNTLQTGQIIDNRIPHLHILILKQFEHVFTKVLKHRTLGGNGLCISIAEDVKDKHTICRSDTMKIVS